MDLKVLLKKLFKSKKSHQINDAFHNPQVLDLDIIKDELTINFNLKKHLRRMLAFVLLALFLCGEAYYVLYLWEQKEIAQRSELLSVEVAKIDKEINAIKAESSDAMDFKSKIESFNAIFGKHPYWTNFFTGILETNTLANVFYSGFGGDLSGAYSLKAAANDVRAMEVQADVFEANTDIISIINKNEALNKGSYPANIAVTFDMNLQVDQNIFTK